MMSTRRRLPAGFLIAVLILVLAACGGANDPVTPTRSAPTSTAPPTTAAGPAATAPAPTLVTTAPAASTSATPATAAIEAATLQVLDAIQHHDRDRLHDMSADHVRDHEHQHDMDHLAACGPEGATAHITHQHVEMSDHHATATIEIETTAADGTRSTSEHTWQFEQDTDGGWRLSELPACPFR